jgi:hypothetical protein
MHLAPCHPLVKTMLLLPQPETLPQLFLLPTGQMWLQRLLKPLMAPLPEAKPPSFLFSLLFVQGKTRIINLSYSQEGYDMPPFQTSSGVGATCSIG